MRTGQGPPSQRIGSGMRPGPGGHCAPGAGCPAPAAIARHPLRPGRLAAGRSAFSPVLATVIGVLMATAAVHGVEYDVVVLGPNATCMAVSDGAQAGYADIAADPNDPERRSHAVLWRNDGRMVDLNPDGCLTSQVWDALGDRQVGVGDDHALLWSGTAAGVIDLHPAGCDYSYAYGLWGDRQAGAGFAESVGEHALLWSGTAESAVDLHPAGFVSSRAGAVWGDKVVGYGVPLGGGRTDWRALLWQERMANVVNLHPAGFQWSCACDVWGRWQVGSGMPGNGGGMQALMWSGTAESVVNLHPEGCRASYVVRCWGDCQVGVGDDHALLWSGSAQSVVDLHRYLPDDYTSSAAFGIDSTGRIAGYAGNGSTRYAVMWVPRYVPVYRCGSPSTSRNLYTTQGREVESLLLNDPNGWSFGGILCHVPRDSKDPNAMPVYQFGARNGSVHFYTIDDAERDKLFREYRDVWTYEGIAFYAYRPARRPAASCPVYRFWSDSLGCHYYTRDEAERDRLRDQPAHVWTYEDIAWYAYE